MTTPDPETLRARAAEIAALAERCERAEGPDRELDGWIAVLIDPERQTIVDLVPGRFPRTPIYGPTRLIMEQVGGKEGADYLVAPTYTASLDAAMTLVPKDDQKCWAAGWGIDGAAFATVGFERQRSAATPALALCAAALRAHLQGNPHDD